MKASMQSKGDESEEMINVGIDIHKRRCQACLKDEKGRLIGEVSFPRDHDGVTSFRRLLRGTETLLPPPT